MRKLCKWNRKTFPDQLFAAIESSSSKNEEAMALTQSDVTSNNSGDPPCKISILDLFRPFPICLRTLNMFYNWTVTTLCYYALTMTASSLSANVFLNFTLLILVEIPAHFFCIVLMDTWGRKPVLSFCQILSGLSCILAGFAEDITWLQVSCDI